MRHAEFVAGTLENGISLKELTKKLEFKSFASTKRNKARGEGNTNPRRSYRQQPAVELSDDGRRWLSRRLNRAFEEHGKVPQDVSRCWTGRIPRRRRRDATGAAPGRQPDARGAGAAAPDVPAGRRRARPGQVRQGAGGEAGGLGGECEGHRGVRSRYANGQQRCLYPRHTRGVTGIERLQPTPLVVSARHHPYRFDGRVETAFRGGLCLVWE